MRTYGKVILAFGAVALMAAPAMAQGRGGYGGGGAGLLRNKSVQQELKATDEQATKLDALAQETMDKNRDKFQAIRDLPEADRPAKMQELSHEVQHEVHKGLADILKPEQVARYKQIEIQAAGTNAFTHHSVQEALKLTDDQKSKVKAINEEMSQAARSAREEAGDDRQAAMKKMGEIRKGAMEKAAALLTEDQQKSWKELIGSPFEVKYEPRPAN